MPNRAPSSLNDRAVAPAARVDAIVDAWLDALPATKADKQRSPALVEGYRALARTALDFAFDGIGASAPVTFGHFEIPAVDRQLGLVAAASRRAGRSGSDLLDDLRHLTLWALDGAGGHDLESRRSEGALATQTRIVLVLSEVSRRVVRVLEASDARARREHDDALSAMTDMVSHELRNRLGAAQTASQMLVSPRVELDGDGLRRAAQLVEASISAALRTVDDVRELASSRSSVTAPTFRVVELAELIRAVIEEQRLAAQKVGVELDTEGPPVQCRVDAARVRLVVFNLVNNGIKYRDDTKDRSWVRVGCEQLGDGHVAMSVADNGVGIPPQELRDVFSYRVRGSDVHDVPGTGLGLAIVLEAVEQMGGEITVTSEPEVGTTFRLVIAPLDEQGGRSTP